MRQHLSGPARERSVLGSCFVQAPVPRIRLAFQTKDLGHPQRLPDQNGADLNHLHNILPKKLLDGVKLV